MLPQSKIDRINALAKKKKNGGLSEEETAEQKILREEFLADFRARFKAQLDNIEFIINKKKQRIQQREETIFPLLFLYAINVLYR